MKSQILSVVLAICVVVGIVLFVNRSQPASDPSDIVDTLVDAGIEFSRSQTDTDLLKYRKLVIATDINAVTAKNIINGLLLLDAIDSTAPIDLYIRTEGGWVSDAFAIIDVIESIGAPVNTYAIGGTYSSGAMILAAGTGIRYGYPDSSIMFHAGLYHDGSEYSGDKVDNHRLNQFWKEHAHVPQEWLKTKTEKTFFLGPDEALKFGLIDQIRTNGKGTHSSDNEGAGNEHR